MFHKEIIAVCPKIRTKLINANCVQNVEFSNVELVVSTNKHLLKG